MLLLLSWEPGPHALRSARSHVDTSFRGGQRPSTLESRIARAVTNMHSVQGHTRSLARVSHHLISRAVPLHAECLLSVHRMQPDAAVPGRERSDRSLIADADDIQGTGAVTTAG